MPARIRSGLGERNEALEERGVKYAIRIPANDSLERDITELLPRPVGRPSKKPLVEYKDFSTRQRVGARRDGSLPRWNITRESCSREWDSS